MVTYAYIKKETKKKSVSDSRNQRRRPLTLHFLLWAPINKKERAQRKEELMD